MSASISASCLTDADAIDLRILRLTGEAFTISVPRTSLGGEVRKLVAQRVASKGRNLSLQHGSKPLVLHQSLEDQGVGPSAALSCVFVPTDLDAAFRFMQGLIDDEFALEGLSKMEGATGWRVSVPPSGVAGNVDLWPEVQPEPGGCCVSRQSSRVGVWWQL